MRKNKLFYLLPALAIGLGSCENRAERGAQNFNDKTEVDNRGLAFVKMATESGLTEVRASTMAQEKSKNPRVISFAKMMIADHTKANQDIKKLADDKTIRESVTISPEHQKTIDSLSKLSGVNFDKGYMAMMVKDHTAAVKLFEETTSNRIDAVQKLAKKTLPALKMHLDTAKTISSALK